VLVELESGKEVVELAGAKPFVAIDVRAFNEELSITRVVLEAQKYADRVVVCDDGSSDLTGEIALRLGADVAMHEGIWVMGQLFSLCLGVLWSWVRMFW
jgi:cellulose synthase/poly-beta-1,6-N-acetylglucosamine synthase-like glycosyltransferase